jgi:hypothetical protein
MSDDIGKIVSDLLEKRMVDFLAEHVEHEGSSGGTIHDFIHDVIAEYLENHSAEIKAKIAAYLDKSIINGEMIAKVSYSINFEPNKWELERILGESRNK